MSFTQGDIQRSAQAALPVLPNNGNPNGAYNAPQVASSTPETTVATADPLSWLQPSEYMQDIQGLLQDQTRRLLMQQNESKQLYNYVPRNGGLNVQYLDDNGIPVSRYQDSIGSEDVVMPASSFMPQYSPGAPVLPQGAGP